MQINRLFEMTYVLLEKKTVAARELAERFEVSVRTIYRDVETLSQAGIPIYMSKGRGGGISLLPDFVLNKAVLTENEKQDILASLNAVNAVDFQETNTAIQKLGSLFGETNIDWIEVDFSMWSDAEQEAILFDTIKMAILKKQVITFVYASAKRQQTNREIEPVKLCFRGGAWYLYGYCRTREDYRFFKLRRIQKLQRTEQQFDRTAPGKIFSEHAYYPHEFLDLKLRISPEMAFRVYDEFESYEQQEDGSFIAQIRYPKDEWLFNYIISFGRHCEVLEPIVVREEIQQEVKKILEMYQLGT